MNTVESLRKAGFTVSVLHSRPFKLKVKARVNHKLKFRDGGMQDKVIYLPKYYKNNPKLKLVERGGVTVVTVKKDKRIIAEEIVLCSETDNYSFKEGVKTALSRMDLAVSGD